MNSIKCIQRLNEKELKLGISGEGSWHADYSHSAYIYVGGLPFGMNEGDIVTVFSQCGEIVDCNLSRDSDTGESKGFVFIGYADQRSTILAVDNFNAATICGRVIKVDHVDKYRVPKEYLEGDEKKVYNPTGPDGTGWGEFQRLTEEAIDMHQKKTKDIDSLWEMEFMNNVHEEAPAKHHSSKKERKENSHKSTHKHKHHHKNYDFGKDKK